LKTSLLNTEALRTGIAYKRILLIMLLTTCISSFSFAGTAGDSTKAFNERYSILNGHKFLVNSIISTPFINTYVQNRLGVGQTMNLSIPETVIEGQPVQVKGELLFTFLNLEYQQVIRDWLAFNASVDILGRLGNKPGSLIAEGIDVAAGYQFGWLFKLYQNKEFMLSGSADVSNRSYTVIDLKDFVQGIIDSGKITEDNKLIKDIPALRAGVGVKGAYAFNSVFGLNAFVNVKYGETAVYGAPSDWFLSYGLAFDADLLPKQKVPVGFLLGFFASSVPGTDGELESYPKNFIFQVNYTGNEDIIIGLESNFQYYRPVDYDDDIKFANFSFNMRYFF
jgi:hypothetical protein